MNISDFFSTAYHNSPEIPAARTFPSNYHPVHITQQSLLDLELTPGSHVLSLLQAVRTSYLALQRAIVADETVDLPQKLSSQPRALELSATESSRRVLVTFGKRKRGGVVARYVWGRDLSLAPRKDGKGRIVHRNGREQTIGIREDGIVGLMERKGRLESIGLGRSAVLTRRRSNWALNIWKAGAKEGAPNT